ncbi:MAG: hypothetical protein HY656_08305 [Acidobacteria bacterium]|nr:hypothetical protein [Acidobacteriota bacterium]
MSATFVSVFILASSVLLLLFWLRSACQSILRQRFEQDYSAEVAEANQLEYLVIRKALSEYPEEIADYSGLLQTLERDYEALTYLLRNAATVHMGRYTRTERLLILDFQLLRLWVRLKRALGWPSWRSGLLEMATILNYFGNVVGHRLVTFPSRLPSL